MKIVRIGEPVYLTPAPAVFDPSHTALADAKALNMLRHRLACYSDAIGLLNDRKRYAEATWTETAKVHVDACLARIDQGANAQAEYEAHEDFRANKRRDMAKAADTRRMLWRIAAE